MDPLSLLKSYLKCPSVSADPAYMQGMADARAVLIDAFNRIGLDVEEVPTDLHSIILAQRKGDSSWPHVVIYGHYDVQPPDPLELWSSDPFEPQLIDGCMVARGAADNKGPFMAYIVALSRLLKEDPNIPLRISVIVEGEEEMGSPSFSPFIRRYKEQLMGDFLFFSDTQSVSTEQVVVSTGLRGISALEVELTGPNMDLHSGVNGGSVRNPIQALVTLLSSLHTPEGWVNIPGFYDAVQTPSNWEREQLRHLDQSEEAYREFLGVPSLYVPPGYSAFEAIRFLPTLEYNGIKGGYQGAGSKTIIPSTASAKLTLRLVPGQEAKKIEDLVIQTLKDRLPSGVSLKIENTGGGDPYGFAPPKSNEPSAANLNPQLLKAFELLDRSVSSVFGKAPLYLKEGGSLPIIAEFKAVTGMDSLMLGLTPPDSKIHAPNEKFDLCMLEKGSEVVFQVLKGLSKKG